MKNTNKAFVERSPFAKRHAHKAPLDQRFGERAAVTHGLENKTLRFAQPLTFTPFASAAPCSARCRFCSETLVSKQTTTLSQTLRPGPAYHKGLARALKALRGLPLGFSLSGLEATDDATWLFETLACLKEHALHSPVEERVLYSNLNGIAGPQGNLILSALEDFALTRVEASRHSHDAERNNAIMRFRDNTYAHNGFDDALRRALKRLPLRLVCVLQKGGVASRDDVLAYVKWAQALGVRDIVFRELSRLGPEYVKGAGVKYVNKNRVQLENLLDSLDDDFDDEHFKIETFTSGYYYWNVRTRFENTLVTFETSDYSEMKKNHASGIVHKLIFHANGKLCGDWDPNTHVLLETKDEPLIRIGA